MLEDWHTIDTTERKSVPVPSILEMEPKKARRAWALWMADQDLEGLVADRELYTGAEYIRLAIEMLILNLGRDGESWAREKLEHQFAAFGALRSRDV